MPYVEVKTRKTIDSTLAKKLVDKKIIGVVTTGTITKQAKELFDQNCIAWAENVTEKKFQETEAREE
jgi:hypothetical protein